MNRGRDWVERGRKNESKMNMRENRRTENERRINMG